MLNGKIGDNAEDIKRIVLLENGNGQIEKVYIKLNNGKVEIIEKDNTRPQYEFDYDVQSFLNSAGATKENKESSWYVTTRERSKDFIYELEQDYKKQNVKLPSVPKKQSTQVAPVTKPKDTALSAEAPKQSTQVVPVTKPKDTALSVEASKQVLAEQEKQVKKKRTYQIKGISDILAPTNGKKLETAICGSLGAGLFALAIHLFAVSHPLIALVPLLLAYKPANKAYINIIDTDYKKIMENIGKFFAERAQATKEDIKEGIDNKFQEIRQSINENIENGRSR